MSSDSKMDEKAKDVVILGAGPVGLAAACLLVKQGFEITVYEARAEIPDDVQDSYPIGTNPRGMHCLEAIDPELKQMVIQESRLVQGGLVFSGKRKVADMKSGIIYSSSRGRLNKLLYQHACKSNKISIIFNHKLREVDFDKRELAFDVYGSDRSVKSQIVVSAAKSRILAADGVHSGMRKAMEAKDGSNFTSEVSPWHSEYRVLFAKPGQQSADLIPGFNYIYNGCYCSVLKSGGLETWTCVLSAKDSAPPEETKLLLAKEPTDANIKALRAYVEKFCPPFSPMVDNEELQRFFGRRSYRGAVVKVLPTHAPYHLSAPQKIDGIH